MGGPTFNPVNRGTKYSESKILGSKYPINKLNIFNKYVL